MEDLLQLHQELAIISFTWHHYRSYPHNADGVRSVRKCHPTVIGLWWYAIKSSSCASNTDVSIPPEHQLRQFRLLVLHQIRYLPLRWHCQLKPFRPGRIRSMSVRFTAIILLPSLSTICTSSHAYG